MNGIGTWLFGFAGGVIGWLLTEFVGKPFRLFFDLRAEIREQMIVFGNVRARWRENDRGAQIALAGDALSEEDERRLRDAENRYRALGAEISAFADTESGSVILVLKLLGYDAGAAGLNLIALSNTVSTYGGARYTNTQAVEKALQIKPN